MNLYAEGTARPSVKFGAIGHFSARFVISGSTNRNRAWTDCGPDAGWRATKFTHESFGCAIPVFFNPAFGALGPKVADTLDALTNIFCWSCNVALSGEHLHRCLTHR